MTESRTHCAHIARTYAPHIPGLGLNDARVPGTPGLRFRTIADMTEPAWHDAKGTANAVGSNGPPGFKSPILRSSPALSRSTQGQGLTTRTARVDAESKRDRPSGAISVGRSHLQDAARPSRGRRAWAM